MASLAVPLLYVFIVFGGLWVFSTIYKRHSANKVIEPYFPRHIERDIYVSLLQRTDPPTPEALLKAALLRRAMTDVTRIMRLREDKPALQNLLQKGSIGDDLWNSLLAAEKELEAEILETAAEANSFVEGWGQLIFTTATEILQNEKMRATVEQLNILREQKEQKYGMKAKFRIVATPQTPATPTAPGSRPQSPAPTSPASPAPTTPVTPSSSAGGLSVPTSVSMETESVASSDGEGSVSSPRSGKSKKSKRRK